MTGGYSYYWREAHTDKDGKFKIPEKWNFSIDFEANFDNDQFLLEDGHSVYGEDLEIEKNDKHSDWKETFTGNKAKWSIVWTAAYQYYHGEIYGLKRPRQNEWWNQSLDIQVYYKNNDDYVHDIDEKYYNGMSTAGSSNKYIFFLSDDFLAVLAYSRSSMEIYSTMIHELTHFAHSVHYQNGPYSDIDDKTCESYARFVQVFLSKKRYRSYQASYHSDYTGIGEDLMDNVTSTADGNNNGFDKVFGFKLKQVETAFLNSKKFMDIKNYLEKITLQV